MERGGDFDSRFAPLKSAMPIIESAKKALRNSARKRIFNLRKSDRIKKTEMKFEKLLHEKKTDEARKLIPMIQKYLDKAAKTGLIKKNTASRKKSRLVRALKRVS